MWKAMANIYVRDEFRCSGVFYKKFVLTTPTHVLGHPKDVKVSVNSLAMPDQNSAPRFAVSIVSFQSHPTARYNNLVLLQPNGTIVHEDYEIEMSPAADNYKAMVFMGWGYSSTGREEFLGYQPMPCPTPPQITPKLASGEEWLSFNQLGANSIAEGAPVFVLKGQVPHIYAISYRGPDFPYIYEETNIVFVRLAQFDVWISDMLVIHFNISRPRISHCN
ncbi:hypothetical protein DSO57_1002877 [Entomophthora muscae]|uniref:Uncharacterized protein n=1 Tax=Entomophthora muscae TaxID=34485 RepID=A0ACC2TWF8_9FUNG|nr:hypothetical protein DSO57_1002877 [Entomophthora muscae]